MKKTALYIILINLLILSSIRCYSQTLGFQGHDFFYVIDSSLKIEIEPFLNDSEINRVRNTQLFFDSSDKVNSMFTYQNQNNNYEIRINQNLPPDLINLVLGSSIIYQLEPNLIPFYTNVYPYIIDSIPSVGAITELFEYEIDSILKSDLITLDASYILVDMVSFFLLHEYGHIVLNHIYKKNILREEYQNGDISIKDFQTQIQHQELESDIWALTIMRNLTGIRLFVMEELFLYFSEPDVYIGTVDDFWTHPIGLDRYVKLLTYDLENYCYDKELDDQNQHWCNLNEEKRYRYEMWTSISEEFKTVGLEKKSGEMIDYDNDDWYKDNFNDFDYETLGILHSLGIIFLRSEEINHNKDAALKCFETVSNIFDHSDHSDSTLYIMNLPIGLKSKFYAGKMYELIKKDRTKAIEYYSMLLDQGYISNEYLTRLITRLKSQN